MFDSPSLFLSFFFSSKFKVGRFLFFSPLFYPAQLPARSAAYFPAWAAIAFPAHSAARQHARRARACVRSGPSTDAACHPSTRATPFFPLPPSLLSPPALQATSPVAALRGTAPPRAHASPFSLPLPGHCAGAAVRVLAVACRASADHRPPPPRRVPCCPPLLAVDPRWTPAPAHMTLALALVPPPLPAINSRPALPLYPFHRIRHRRPVSRLATARRRPYAIADELPRRTLSQRCPCATIRWPGKLDGSCLRAKLEPPSFVVPTADRSRRLPPSDLTGEPPSLPRVPRLVK